MLNSGLKYMLNDDPSKTISKQGIERRKKIRPLLLFLLKLSNKQKLTVEKNEFDESKETRPIVYVCSHGFKDDCQNMLISARPNGYLVFGNIDLYFNTFDGTIAWLYGSQLIDRFSKSSRDAMKVKMDKLLEMGGNVIIFSEATWNMSPNKPMLGLHWGFYDTAVKNNAVIVPCLTHKVGDECYSRVLSSIDPKEVWKEDSDLIYYKMKKYLEKAKDIMMYKGKEADPFNECFSVLEPLVDKYGKLVDNVASLQNIDDIDIATSRAIDKMYGEMNAMLNKIELLASQYKQLFSNLISSDDKSIEADAYRYIARLIFRIGTARKEVVVKYVRDTMALEKVDMYEKHPDNSYMDESADMYEAWDKYIDETLHGTPYFYPEEEKSTEFKDPLISEIDEVMPWLKDKAKDLK